MVRVASVLVLVLSIVGPAAAQSRARDGDMEAGAQRALESARSIVARVQQGVASDAEVHAFGADLLRAVGTAQIQALAIQEPARRAAALDACNTTLITAAFTVVRPVATPDLEVPLVSFFVARDHLQLRHLPLAGRDVHEALEALVRAARPRDLHARSAAEARELAEELDRELLEAEAALRAMLPVKELRPYVRPMAQLLETLVRGLRARSIGRLSLSCVGAIVDGAYVAARAPAGAHLSGALRVTPGALRTDAACAVGVELDVPAAKVGRFDVELVDRTGARVALGRGVPAAGGAHATATIALSQLEVGGPLRLVASALLESGEVVVTTVAVTAEADADILDPAGLPPVRGLSDRLDRASERARIDAEIEREVAEPARRSADELRRAEADLALARVLAERAERDLERLEAMLRGRAAPLRPRR